MSTALATIASNTGVSQDEVTNVLRGMIVSAKNQHGATATDAELAVVSSVCAKYDLNPLVKECAAFVSGGKLQMIVMIDGWYRIVNRQENFDGVEFSDEFDEDKKLSATTCKMYLKNRAHPVCVTEYMAECMDVKSNVWKKWPNRMLRHKAYIQAARMAFGISEMIDDDEAARYNQTPERDITPQAPAVDLKELDEKMQVCKTHDELDEATKGIRQLLETSGQWASAKGDLVLMKREHVNRIDALNNDDDVIDVEFDVETGEVLEVE